MQQQTHIEQAFASIGQLKKLLEGWHQDASVQKNTTAMQFFALHFIHATPNSTIGDVAAYMKLSKSSATQLVERMVRLSLIERTQDTDDRRIIHLTLTSTGDQQLGQMKQEFFSRILAKVPVEDLQALTRINTKLITILQEERNQ
jgi:DNA-binding MarR family transcriptional regulator